MKTKEKILTLPELAKRWDDCSPRTVFRYIKQYGLVPFNYQGKSPVFRLTDVLAMEARRVDAMNARAGYTPDNRLLSMREIKHQARRAA